MYLNNFSVRIPQGKEEDSGYVIVEHATQYQIVLRNANVTKCNAEVKIDGKHQGTWRIDAQSSITIERPAHDDGKFTFYRVNSAEGDRIGLNADDSDTGLIKVTFTPEKDVVKEVTRSFGSGQSASKGLSAGGTGLSGNSWQKFGVAERIDLDHSKDTVIHLRLVAKDRDEPRPLTNYSNPVPPPIR